jgi:hypothetical protein
MIAGAAAASGGGRQAAGPHPFKTGQKSHLFNQDIRRGHRKPGSDKMEGKEPRQERLKQKEAR